MNTKQELQLTDEQWKECVDKYGKLVLYIAQRISGDNAISTIEDNVADLQVALLEGINGFYRKTGDTFDDMMKSKMFPKYVKSCLWNKKGNKGSLIKKKYPVTNTVSLSSSGALNKEGVENRTLDIVSTSISFESIMAFEEEAAKFTIIEKTIVDLVVKNPEVLKSDGRVNIKLLGKKLNCSGSKTRRLVNTLGKKIRNGL